jgi:transposase InsO family protein
MDMHKYQDLNAGHRYILVAIDCLSRYAWIRALRNKKSEVVANAFRDILTPQTKPQVVHSDAGLEFRGAPFQQLLRDNNIRFFTSHSNFKAAIAERFIRTLKERLVRFFLRLSHRISDCLQRKSPSRSHGTHTETGCGKPLSFRHSLE